jgi:hypothetical protein
MKCRDWPTAHRYQPVADSSGRANEAIEVFFTGILWGRPVSTWVVNLEVRTEVQCPSLNTLQIIVANDDNYALAA